jgi:hypothetical protein
MGISIEGDDDAPGVTHTVLVLSCDAQGCGKVTIFDRSNYVENHSWAMREGWLERQGERQGRTFLCPACSGKRR